MNISVLIGNGFDLNLGLRTDYRSFYDYYESLDSDTEQIKRVKENIRDEIKLWSDLEVRLGEIASTFSADQKGADEYLEICNDIIDALGEYIGDIDSRLSLKPTTNDPFKILSNRIIYLNEYLQPPERNRLSMQILNSSINIDYLTFNYTHTLDLLFDDSDSKKISVNYYEPGKPPDLAKSTVINITGNLYHIHGYHDNSLIMGVNDPSQINNVFIAKDRMVQETIIKNIANHSAQSGADEKFANSIRRANLIIIYGMSRGKTDLLRWNLIIDELLKRDDVKLLICEKGNKSDVRRSYQLGFKREKIRKNFISLKKLTSDQIEKIAGRITVSIGCKIFDNLPVYKSY